MRITPAYAIQPNYSHLAALYPALSVSLVRQSYARKWAASIALFVRGKGRK